jgi:hypothetical protein
VVRDRIELSTFRFSGGLSFRGQLARVLIPRILTECTNSLGLNSGSLAQQEGEPSEPINSLTLLSRHKRRRPVDRITDRYHVLQ